MLKSVSDFVIKWATCQQYPGENKLHSIWDDVRFILDQYPYLGFIVLAHRKNSPLLDRSLHWDTLFWFRTYQSFRLLFNAASLADNHKCQYLSLWLTRPRFEPTTYHIRSEHADHYIDVVILWEIIMLWKHNTRAYCKSYEVSDCVDLPEPLPLPLPLVLLEEALHLLLSATCK
jgi:hypothetical protein